jgi:hypothetical protein
MTTPNTDQGKTAVVPELPDFLVRLQPHPLSDWFDMMEGEELENLGEDIRKNGLHERITTLDGKILDGRNRYRAGMAVGYKFKKEDFVELPKGVDPLAFVFSKNFARRHLTAEQKRAVIEKLLKERPEASSRAIAAIAKVSHHTVEAVRQQEPTGQLAQLPAAPRTGRDGKKRQQGKQPKQKSALKLFREVETFKATWEQFNHTQKRKFVWAVKDEIVKLVEEVELEEAAEEEEAKAA